MNDPNEESHSIESGKGKFRIWSSPKWPIFLWWEFEEVDMGARGRERYAPDQETPPAPKIITSEHVRGKSH